MRQSKLIAAVGAAILTGGVSMVVAPAASATTPPWEPDSHSFGTLTLYDASGNQVTTGNINDDPMVAYVVGSNAGRAGDHTTLLNAFQPTPDATTDNWSGDTLTGATDYPLPASGNPANIVALSQTHPVSKGTPTDFTVADFIAEYPNTDPSGLGCRYAPTPAGCTNTAYQNLYQLRLITANGADQNPQYETADILVSGDTWTQVYPSTSTPDTTSLTISGPSSVRVGSSATLSTVLTDTTTSQPISGADVVLQRRANSSAPWSTVATVTTSSTGAASRGVALTANTQFRWTYAGDTTRAAATSPVKSVSVTLDSTSLTMSGPASSKYGARANFSTVLKDTTTNKAISGAHVLLKRRAGATKPWSTVSTVTTSSTGAASTAVTFTANGQYQWTYAGDSTHKSSASPVKTVSIAQVVAIHSTRSSVRRGVVFKIWGTVQPASGGQQVTLQHLVGTSWRRVGAATIKRQKMPNGSTTTGYLFNVKESTRGTYRFRVEKAATSTLAKGDSSTVTVKVT